ncbi:glycosyltransferase [Salegentibacter chungangensis]|uniref:Glycosyltransferase n=1 Tax=Salegentibacter chungangensis TaxID=1335724 RepID=A0ABW3NX32_9FLAO
MKLDYSFVIPVYNRPDEIRELLQSMEKIAFDRDFEIVIVEDGSDVPADKVVEEFRDKLQISYYSKPNSGPGSSRNYGMERAKGNYFLILDSDVIMPPDYLEKVDSFLKVNYSDCFGGPDAAHKSFSDIQKAIDFSMTSFLTTGGIRGKKRSINKFQPRSFNMGISRKAFEKTKGFGRIHPGEDPDLSMRIQKAGFHTCLIEGARVFHKRRIDWKKFYQQVYKFGLVRPILNCWHKGSAKITYWFPTLFVLGFLVSLIFTLMGFWIFSAAYLFYFLIIGLDAAMKHKNLYIGLLAILATIIQFIGYGYGFLKSYWHISVLKENPEKQYPNLFFSE